MEMNPRKTLDPYTRLQVENGRLQQDIEELTFCEDCGEDCAKLESNGCYPPRYCHACRGKLVEEIVLLRKIVNGALGAKMLWSVEQKLHGIGDPAEDDDLSYALMLVDQLAYQVGLEQRGAMEKYQKLKEANV